MNPLFATPSRHLSATSSSRKKEIFLTSPFNPASTPLMDSELVMVTGTHFPETWEQPTDTENGPDRLITLVSDDSPTFNVTFTGLGKCPGSEPCSDKHFTSPSNSNSVLPSAPTLPSGKYP